MSETAGAEPRDPEPPGSVAGSVERRPRLPGWAEFPLLVLGALLVAFLVKTFLVQAFYIPSGSMEDSLQIGDRVLVNKVVYRVRPVERGDVIVFDGTGSFVVGGEPLPRENPVQVVVRSLGELVGLAPPGDRDFIKRVIGVGGDRVVCCDAEDRLTVNGVPLDEESYLFPGDTPSRQPFDVLVPAGTLWVMGDHRSASADSRAHLGDPGGGFVPVDRVIGRAFAVVWPVGQTQILEIPATFENPALVDSTAGGVPSPVP